MIRKNQSATISAAALAALLGLSACGSEEQASFEDADPAGSPEPAEGTGESEQDEAEGQETEESVEPADPETAEADGVAASATFFPHYGGSLSGDVTLEAVIGPVVRDGDLAALSMDFDYQEGEDTLSTINVLHGLAGVADGSRAYGQVRLIDPDAMTVAELARTEQGEGSIAAASGSSGDRAAGRAEPGDTLNWYGVFAAPESDTVSVLLPHFGLVSDVPVMEGDLDEANSTDESLDPSDVAGQSHELVSWRDTPSTPSRSKGMRRPSASLRRALRRRLLGSVLRCGGGAADGGGRDGRHRGRRAADCRAYR
ncbi:hypothetical protein [Nesterenkonia pannonica]|uniref:hypothetical protein n=1 Tax=Nesterenkonia pannonica TaxID=1548602 RepID=UPI002164C9AA|nr:hypothetical protein [Nesterenkonia pannonica]